MLPPPSMPPSLPPKPSIRADATTALNEAITAAATSILADADAAIAAAETSILADAATALDAAIAAAETSILADAATALDAAIAAAETSINWPIAATALDAVIAAATVLDIGHRCQPTSAAAINEAITAAANTTAGPTLLGTAQATERRLPDIQTHKHRHPTDRLGHLRNRTPRQPAARVHS